MNIKLGVSSMFPVVPSMPVAVQCQSGYLQISLGGGSYVTSRLILRQPTIEQITVLSAASAASALPSLSKNGAKSLYFGLDVKPSSDGRRADLYLGDVYISSIYVDIDVQVYSTDEQMVN